MGDFSSWRMWCLAGLALVLAASLAHGQRPHSCDVRKSSVPEMVDVHCNCMQRLTQMDLPIAQLVVNQTGCEDLGLELSWSELETRVAPQTLVMVGASVFFRRQTTLRPWMSSLIQVEFLNCKFEVVPPFAFQGLSVLETIKIIGSRATTIQSRALDGLSRLQSVHIVNSTIDVIEGKAFTNLQHLTEIIIMESTIGEVKTDAMDMRRSATQEVRCDEINISANSSGILHQFTGRQLPIDGNLNLPDYGTKFVIFKTNISLLATRAISSDAFGFLIVGGNHIETVQARAFNMELYNECEISAALFVGNEFTRLEDYALTGLKGRDGVSYQTFIALSHNTFQSVVRHGFVLDDAMSIFSVDENQFYCSCDRFDWILSGDGSQTQRELEKELVLKATCVEGGSLISFTSSCPDLSTVEQSWTTTPSPASSTSTVSTTSFTSTVPTTTRQPFEQPSSAAVVSLGNTLSIVLAVIFAKLMA